MVHLVLRNEQNIQDEESSFMDVTAVNKAKLKMNAFSSHSTKFLQRKSCFKLSAMNIELADAQVLQFNQQLAIEVETLTF